MCGIAFVKSLDGRVVNKQIKRLYFGQKERGVRGYGFLSIQPYVYYRTRNEHQIMQFLKMNKSFEMLFHHRNPTSTPNTEHTAHPIYTGGHKYKYYLAHNGSVYNANKLREKHERDFKIKYSTDMDVLNDKGVKETIFNDSEALLHEIVLFLEGKIDKVEANGPASFVLLQMTRNNKPLKLFFGRNENKPLKAMTKRGVFMLSSGGNGKLIEADKLFSYDYQTGKTSIKDFAITPCIKLPSGRNAPDWYSSTIGTKSNEPTLLDNSAFNDVLDFSDDYEYAIKDMDDKSLLAAITELSADRSVGQTCLKEASDKEERDHIASDLRNIDSNIDRIKTELLKRGFSKKEISSC